MKKLLTLTLLLSTVAFAKAPYQPEVHKRFLEIEKFVTKDVASSGDGRYAGKYFAAEIDYTDIEAQSDVAIQINVPDNAIITNCFYDVHTTFTSSSDAATIGFQIESSEDLFAPTAISSGTTWDAAGPKQMIPDWATVGDQIKLTAARDLEVLRGGGEDLTAGAMTVFCNYFVAK